MSSIPYSSTAKGSSTKIVVVVLVEVVVLSSVTGSIGSAEISTDEGSEPQVIKTKTNKVNKYFLIGI
jgi:hypothetical protein